MITYTAGLSWAVDLGKKPLMKRRSATQISITPKALFSFFSDRELAYSAPNRAVIMAVAAISAATFQSAAPWK